MGISKIKVCCLIIFLLAAIQDVAAQINFGIKAGYLRSKTATEIIPICNPDKASTWLAPAAL